MTLRANNRHSASHQPKLVKRRAAEGPVLKFKALLRTGWRLLLALACDDKALSRATNPTNIIALRWGLGDGHRR